MPFLRGPIKRISSAGLDASTNGKQEITKKKGIFT